jgi:hypothetical protein
MRLAVTMLMPVTAALLFLQAGCSTTKPLSPGDLSAAETALTLLLVDKQVKIDQEDRFEKYLSDWQRAEHATRMTNELRKLQDTLARAGDKLPITLYFYGKQPPAVGEFSRFCRVFWVSPKGTRTRQPSPERSVALGSRAPRQVTGLKSHNAELRPCQG